VKNWDLQECVIFEMWDVQDDPEMAAQERNFQKMLTNNMEAVFKTFFRGVKIVKIK